MVAEHNAVKYSFSHGPEEPHLPDGVNQRVANLHLRPTLRVEGGGSVRISVVLRPFVPRFVQSRDGASRVSSTRKTQQHS